MVKWLKVVPLRPSSYFDFQAGVENRDVRFIARPADANEDGRAGICRRRSQRSPCSSVIRGDGTVFPAGRIVPDAFTPDRTQAQLTVQPFEGVRGRQNVAIDADGVPRAVLWNVVAAPKS